MPSHGHKVLAFSKIELFVSGKSDAVQHTKPLLKFRLHLRSSNAILSLTSIFVTLGLYSANLQTWSNRQPETVFVPQMLIPENGQSWQRVDCLRFQASRALVLTRTLFSLQYPKEMW